MSVYSLSTLPKSVSIDRALIPKSYRDYLDILKGMGELIEIDDEVDWYLELGAIFRHSAETLAPGAIFNNVKGCPPGFRAADFGMGKSGRPGQPWARLATFVDAELVVLLDEHRQQTGTAQKSVVHDAHTPLHLAPYWPHRQADSKMRGSTTEKKRPLNCINLCGQGRDRTGDLPLFRRTLIPTELPGRKASCASPWWRP